jgi:prepilin-type N-terminal cleavage/methylation domain-containing protein
VGASAGFTLTEVLVVCALLGLLLAIAVPNYSAMTESLRLRNLTFQFAADVRLAQELAQREWTRSRLLFGSDHYELQIGVSPQPSLTCATSVEYTTVKRADLAGLTAHQRNWPMSCLIFEKTGRAAWTAPSIYDATNFDTMSKIPLLLDGERFPKDVGPVKPTNPSGGPVVWWPSSPQVDVVVDLGSSQMVDTICAGLVRYDNTPPAVEWPSAITLAWSPTPIPINSPSWQNIATVNLTPQAGQWRTCPVFQVNSIVGAPVRYLRFHFTAVKGVAIDEIEILPTITFTTTSGRSRTATISPATGAVSISE